MAKGTAFWRLYYMNGAIIVASRVEYGSYTLGILESDVFDKASFYIIAIRKNIEIRTQRGMTMSLDGIGGLVGSYDEALKGSSWTIVGLCCLPSSPNSSSPPWSLYSGISTS
eukprot:Gb_32283 [translate_table: standard]